MDRGVGHPPLTSDGRERVRRWLTATAWATFVVVVAGGFVRAAGAGLGCEHWPKCFEWSWFPPLSEDDIPPGVDKARICIVKAWIEYGNRLVGALFGVMVLAALAVTWKHARNRRDVLWPCALAAAFTGLEGWIGGMVVKAKLDPRLVSVHLLLAYLIVLLLASAAIAASRDPAGPLPAREPALAGHARFAGFTLVVAIAQAVLGSLVRGSIDLFAPPHRPAAELPPRDTWLASVGWLDWVHRKLAIALIVLLFWCWWRARKLPAPQGPRIERAAFFTGLGLAGLVLTGIALAHAGLPPAAQVLHVALGPLLCFGLFWQWSVARGNAPA